MATTISSGRGSSPLLTANIADHGTIYGGRGIKLDGVSDYLDYNGKFSITNGDDWSLSAWVNPIAQDISCIWGQSNGGYGARFIVYNDDQLQFDWQDSGNTGRQIRTTDAPCPVGVWAHVTVTWESQTKVILYVNGEKKLEVTSNITLNSSNSNVDGQSRQEFLTTQYPNVILADVKRFDVALTEAQVQELYLKPEQSAPSDVQANLKQWFPMCEGNPDSPQSIVYDHSEKGLGSDTFVSLSNFSAKNVSLETVEVSGDELILTIPSGNDAGMQSGNLANLGFSTALGYAVGDTIKFQLEAKITSNGSGHGDTIRIYDTSGYVLPTTNISLTSEYQTFTIYGSVTNLGYSIPYFLRMGNRTGTDVYKFKNFSSQKILMGNHATTVFYGDELQDATFSNGDMEGFASASATGFTAVNTNASIGDNDSAYGKALTIVAGKTYKLDFTIAINSGTLPALYVAITTNTDISAGGLTPYQTYTSAGARSVTFVASAGGTYYGGCRFTGNGTYNFTVSAFSVKEVGVSSTGFATADSEPTIPQVPLLRYNEKMMFGASGDEVVTISNFPSITGQYTASNWNVHHTYIGTNYSPITIAEGTDNTTKPFIREDSATQWQVLYKVGVAWQILAVTHGLSVGDLYHVAVVYDGTNLKCYINGVEKGSASKTAPSASTSTTMYIGKQSQDNNFGYGYMDEVSVWNTGLSATEIQELFNGGVALDATTHSKADYLVGYWRNDGVSSWIDRSEIQAVSLDGTDDFITLPTSIAFALDDYPTGSYSLWFYANDQDPSTQYVVGGRDGSSNTRVYAQLTTSGLSIVMGDDSDSGNDYAYTAKQWNHILVSWSSGTATLYINGVAQSNLITFSAGAGANSYQFVLGANHAGNAYFFDGLIGQFALWNTAQGSNASAIYALGRKASLSAYSSGMEANYIMNPDHSTPDVTGSNGVKDRSGNDEHATITSATILGTNDGTPAGTPESIIVREGLNSNKDGLGFPFKNDDRDVLRVSENANEYLEISDSDIYSFGDGVGDNPFSLEAWVKMEDATSFPIISKGFYNTDFEWLLWTFTDDKLRFALGDESEASCYIGRGYNTALTSLEGTWIHIIATYNASGASSGVKLYLNGDSTAVDDINDQNNEGDYDAMENLGSSVYIGKYGTTYAKGLIDEVKVYNKVLSPTEISKNYKHGKGKHK